MHSKLAIFLKSYELSVSCQTWLCLTSSLSLFGQKIKGKIPTTCLTFDSVFIYICLWALREKIFLNNGQRVMRANWRKCQWRMKELPKRNIEIQGTPIQNFTVKRPSYSSQKLTLSSCLGLSDLAFSWFRVGVRIWNLGLSMIGKKPLRKI